MSDSDFGGQSLFGNDPSNGEGAPPAPSGGGGTPPIIPVNGGYWLNGKFISSNPGSAFYKSPRQLANEAAGLDQFGQNPSNIGNVNTGWFNTQGEWVSPKQKNTEIQWQKPIKPKIFNEGGDDPLPMLGRDPNLTDRYANPLFSGGWYRPTDRYRQQNALQTEYYSNPKNDVYTPFAGATPNTGHPQTYEEAQAISDHVDKTGLLPTSEWVRSYMDANYPNRGQSNSGMSYFPGSTPWELGQRRSGDTLTRNEAGVLKGPWFDENNAYNKANLPQETPLTVKTQEELTNDYIDKLSRYYRERKQQDTAATIAEYQFDYNALLAEAAKASNLSEETRRRILSGKMADKDILPLLNAAVIPGYDDKAKLDLMERFQKNTVGRQKDLYELGQKYDALVEKTNATIDALDANGQPITAYPGYKELTGLYGDIFRQEPYLRQAAEQEQRQKNNTYGSNPNWIPPRVQNTSAIYNSFVAGLPVSQAAKSWLAEQYPLFANEWTADGSKGEFTDFVRQRIQSSVNQFESRYNQNPRFAPQTQSRFIPNVR